MPGRDPCPWGWAARLVGAAGAAGSRLRELRGGSCWPSCPLWGTFTPAGRARGAARPPPFRLHSLRAGGGDYGVSRPAGCCPQCLDGLQQVPLFPSGHSLLCMAPGPSRWMPIWGAKGSDQCPSRGPEEAWEPWSPVLACPDSPWLQTPRAAPSLALASEFLSPASRNPTLWVKSSLPVMMCGSPRSEMRLYLEAGSSRR